MIYNSMAKKESNTKFNYVDAFNNSYGTYTIFYITPLCCLEIGNILHYYPT